MERFINIQIGYVYMNGKERAVITEIKNMVNSEIKEIQKEIEEEE